MRDDAHAHDYYARILAEELEHVVSAMASMASRPYEVAASTKAQEDQDMAKEPVETVTLTATANPFAVGRRKLSDFEIAIALDQDRLLAAREMGGRVSVRRVELDRMHSDLHKARYAFELERELTRYLKAVAERNRTKGRIVRWPTIRGELEVQLHTIVGPTVSLHIEAQIARPLWDCVCSCVRCKQQLVSLLRSPVNGSVVFTPSGVLSIDEHWALELGLEDARPGSIVAQGEKARRAAVILYTATSIAYELRSSACSCVRDFLAEKAHASRATR